MRPPPDQINLKTVQHDPKMQRVYFRIDGWQDGQPISTSGAFKLVLPEDVSEARAYSLMKEAVREYLVKVAKFTT